MKDKIRLLAPDISTKGVDHRGAIYSYVPHNAILEFVYIDTKQGVTRGHHYHEEYDEYIMLMQGEGLYVCPQPNGTVEHIIMGAGQAIHIPQGCPHTFVPLTDCKSVSMLTKPWNQCDRPLTPYSL